MIPGMNPKQMQKMMKQMGVKQQPIKAEQVIVLRPDGSRMVFSNPDLQKVDMMGQSTYQLTGDVSIEQPDTSVDISDEDVQTVMDQTGVSEEEATQAIEEAGGDLAEAILTLSD